MTHKLEKCYDHGVLTFEQTLMFDVVTVLVLSSVYTYP